MRNNIKLEGKGVYYAVIILLVYPSFVNPLYAKSCVNIAFSEFCGLQTSLQLQAKKETLLLASSTP